MVLQIITIRVLLSSSAVPACTIFKGTAVVMFRMASSSFIVLRLIDLLLLQLVLLLQSYCHDVCGPYRFD